MSETKNGELKVPYAKALKLVLANAVFVRFALCIDLKENERKSERFYIFITILTIII